MASSAVSQPKIPTKIPQLQRVGAAARESALFVDPSGIPSGDAGATRT